MWDAKNESMSRDDIERLQLERLRSVLERVYEEVPHYRRKFNEARVDVSKITSLSDLEALPFTTKDDFRENYPFGMFAVPLKKVVRIHSSSGTTGKPTVVGYTRRDIDTWSDLVARIAVSAGVTEEDIVHIAFGYGLFTGGFGLHYGLEKLGATVVPVSSGNTKRQVMLMADYGATVLVCTPSYSLYIAEVAKEMGIDPVKDLNLRIGMFGAEPWSEGMRSKIEEALGIDAYDNYGLSEVIGPGVSGECEEKSGMHIFEDHFIAEVVDPQTLKPVKEGEYGELVITTLTKEALPVIRYRTRDLTRLRREKCKCGRSFVKMDKPVGRTDDMLIIRGVNVFPSQIEEVLFSIEGISPHYQIIVDRQGALDVAEIQIEANENIFFDEMKKQRMVVDKIKDELRSMLGIDIGVRFVEPHSLERSTGKIKRVIDRRKI